MYSFFLDIAIVVLGFIKILIINIPALVLILIAMAMISKLTKDKAFFRRIIRNYLNK